MNDIDKMPSKCRDCPYWELATDPYVCSDCTTPVKKCGGDYILRSDANKALIEWYKDTADRRSWTEVINDIPAADVEPVIHGRWVSKEGIYGVVYCSICDFELKIDNTPRCPNCGAKMDKEEDDV